MSAKGVVHLKKPFLSQTECCKQLVIDLPDGDVFDFNPINVTCGKVELVELKIGDHIIVHDREFVLTEAFFEYNKPASIYFDSVEELAAKQEKRKVVDDETTNLEEG